MFKERVKEGFKKKMRGLRGGFSIKEELPHLSPTISPSSSKRGSGGDLEKKREIKRGFKKKMRELRGGFRGRRGFLGGFEVEDEFDEPHLSRSKLYKHTDYKCPT